jgi:epoxide hydrolase-like predicted phosphatase
MSGTRGGSDGLLLDYGGVLTTPVADSFLAWEREQGLGRGEVLRLIRSAYDDEDGGLIGRLERGEISTDHFDAKLGRLLGERGHDVPDGSLVDRMFAGMKPAGDMWDVADRARSAGIRVGLLSNSWGTAFYPRRRLASCFDDQVISGEVGLRKPDPAIYELAARRLGVEPQRCAFVDDLARNVEVAEQLGMFGVVHAGDTPTTLAALERFLPIGSASATG